MKIKEIKIPLTGNECKLTQLPDNEKLDYLGFCTWTVGVGDGILLPGNHNIGYCFWKNRYYAFLSSSNFINFSRKPEK